MPIEWLSSSTHAFYPDESNVIIRRTYTHPSQSRSKRSFCGFCGTPISYWTEEPASEAEYISLALGSIVHADLLMLDALGLVHAARNDDDNDTTASLLASVPLRIVGGRRDGASRSQTKKNKKQKTTTPAGEQDRPSRTAVHNAQDDAKSAVKTGSVGALPKPTPGTATETSVVSRASEPVKLFESFGVPWFDALISGSRLHKSGNLKRTTGSSQSKDGRMRSEWEIVEWTEGDTEADEAGPEGDEEDESESEGVDDEDNDGQGSQDEVEREEDQSHETTPSGSVKRKRGSQQYQATVEDVEEKTV